MRNDSYYIVDISDIGNPFYYGMAFEDEGQAISAIDSCLGEGYYRIYKGDYLVRLKVPYKRPGPLTKYTPTDKVLAPKYYRQQREKFFSRIKGLGIRTHLFRALWEPLPKDSLERGKVFKKDRNAIWYKILKES